jgi:hypothetical protein
VRQEDVLLLLRREPCPLLRLHLTGGTTFDIQDPEQVILTRTTVELLAPPHGSREREVVINLLHVVWIEVISPEG